MIGQQFPFGVYFSNAPQPIFKGRTFDEDFDIAEGCFRHIKKVFAQLEVIFSYIFNNIFKIVSARLQLIDLE